MNKSGEKLGAPREGSDVPGMIFTQVVEDMPLAGESSRHGAGVRKSGDAPGIYDAQLIAAERLSKFPQIQEKSPKKVMFRV